MNMTSQLRRGQILCRRLYPFSAHCVRSFYYNLSAYTTHLLDPIDELHHSVPVVPSCLEWTGESRHFDRNWATIQACFYMITMITQLFPFQTQNPS